MVWRTSWLALLTATGLALPAQAQMVWPMDPGPNYYEPPRRMEPSRPRVMRTKQKLPETLKDNAKPVGPIIIAISIDRQQLKLYDQNGLFAETPVSTGMRGHSTPMGVFSIIQKNKYHRSNIYSGAPMPYMQRITWSGVALHAGVLPGYPASHGCIRMPMNFAMRMWGWTRMGARVIITPGEVSPADFSHPLLVAKKPETKPLAAAREPDKRAEAAPQSEPVSIAHTALQDKPELRLVPITDRHEPIRTADASGALPQKDDLPSDVSAKSVTSDDAVTDKTAAQDDAKKDVTTDVTAAQDKADTAKPEEAKTGDTKSADMKSEDSKPEDVKPAAAKADTPQTDESKSDTIKTGEIKINKDQIRSPDPVTPSAEIASMPPLEGSAEFVGPVKPRSGHIAAYVSRKENKLYVRQNFEPWFETPVTIAGSDRPLGTHVFTVRADRDDANALHWSVVSLPAPVRVARSDDDRPRRKRAVVTEPAAPAPPSSPTEALDRLSIPADAMTRIASELAPGGSLVVSDQGLGDETGRGTDFIVPLR